jgi:hypothetical protein
VRSRSLRLSVPRPSRDESMAWLSAKGLSSEDAAQALELVAQAPLDALALADQAYVELRERFLRDLSRPRELPTLAWGAWVEAGGKAGRRARFAVLLNLLMEWVAAWTRQTAGLAAQSVGEWTKELSNLAPKLAGAEGIRFYRETLRKLTLPDTTLSARLQIEAILLEYRAKFS